MAPAGGRGRAEILESPTARGRDLGEPVDADADDEDGQGVQHPGHLATGGGFIFMRPRIFHS
jgi:hypothetical protein